MGSAVHQGRNFLSCRVYHKLKTLRMHESDRFYQSGVLTFTRRGELNSFKRLMFVRRG